MDIIDIDLFRKMSNREIFIALARGLHQYYDHGGISFGRGYQADLLDSFRLRLHMANSISFNLLTDVFFDGGIIFGHIIKDRRYHKRKRFKACSEIEELPDMSLAYMALDELIYYFESGKAQSEGWMSQIPLNYAKAMRSMLELDFDFSGIQKVWTEKELITEGERRNREFNSALNG